MRICICTIPTRIKPTVVPPLGSMAIIQSLRKVCKSVQFYNLDLFRPKQEEIEAYFSENQFDIVGISAVVSTAYSYTKYLAGLIRTVSPITAIVVGGNLAASAEILLHKCEVDFCVVGEGEFIMRDLIEALENKTRNYDQMEKITGICFLDNKGTFHFTGYRKSIPADELEWPDYSILEADGSLSHYLQDSPYWMERYGLEIPDNLYGKKHATVPVAKGCVNSCTFCHRWIKGYRARPVEQIMEHIQYLKERYNVGFIDLFDEAFGSNKRHSRELATRLGEMGLAWRTGAARARSVDQEMLLHWKDNGCHMVNFGIESGSQTILDVMEKRTTVQDNINALKWTYEARLATVIQLVVGMPGETDQTIQETIDFLKKCMPYYATLFKDHPGTIQTTTYAQALPGTPLYEYARKLGFLGNSLDDEEKYLIKISDTNAVDTKHFINYTKQPLLKVLTWRVRVIIEMDAHYIKHILGISLSLPEAVWHYLLRLFSRAIQPLWGKVCSNVLNLKSTSKQKTKKQANLMNCPLFMNPLSLKCLYLILPIKIAKIHARSPVEFFSLIFNLLYWNITHKGHKSLSLPIKSLRELVVIEPPVKPGQGSEEAIPLRKGR